jgi:Holliday junction resolvase-like predicted endonuclease
MLEKEIERRVVRWLRERGCICLKLNLIGSTGWPDRLVLAKGGRMFFLELKRPGERLRRNQPERVDLLRNYGFFVGVYDDTDECIAKLEATFFPKRGD